MKIIGISGRMKSGKSTVAEYLESEGIGETFGFSYCIKKMASEFFTDHELYPPDFNRQSIKESLHSSGKDYRTVLQDIGREMRVIWPDIWIANWKWALENGGAYKPIIVPDVRFPNEVKAIQEMGGIVIRLTRNPVDSDDETETALDKYGRVNVNGDHVGYVKYYKNHPKSNKTFNHVVDNTGLSIDETNKICLEIAKEYLNETR